MHTPRYNASRVTITGPCVDCGSSNGLSGFWEDAGAAIGSALKGASGKAFETPQAQAAVKSITEVATKAAFEAAKSEVAKLVIPSAIAAFAIGWYISKSSRGRP